jgi:D-hexose-6-phosphate mutarotase
MKKLSKLDDKDLLFVCTSNNYDGDLITKEDILNDLDYYKNKAKTDEKFEIYTTKAIHAYLNAEDILNDAIENEECDRMYEDWGERIWEDIEKKDIDELQAIYDRILARHPAQNISYHHVALVEFDI